MWTCLVDLHDPGQGLLLSTSRLRTRHRDYLAKAGLLSFDFRVGAGSKTIAMHAQADGDSPSLEADSQARAGTLPLRGEKDQQVSEDKHRLS